MLVVLSRLTQSICKALMLFARIFSDDLPFAIYSLSMHSLAANRVSNRKTSSKLEMSIETVCRKEHKIRF